MSQKLKKSLNSGQNDPETKHMLRTHTVCNIKQAIVSNIKMKQIYEKLIL